METSARLATSTIVAIRSAPSPFVSAGTIGYVKTVSWIRSGYKPS
jgi:hypothetical protein